MRLFEHEVFRTISKPAANNAKQSDWSASSALADPPRTSHMLVRECCADSDS